jgi:hypothetical protein
MTFKGNNMTLDSAGEILMEAGGATVSIDKMGQILLSSPTGIDLVCGASSLSILPGGIAIASPAVAAVAGSGGSKMSMGAEAG